MFCWYAFTVAFNALLLLLIHIFTSIDDLNRARTEQFFNCIFSFVYYKLICSLCMFVISAKSKKCSVTVQCWSNAVKSNVFVPVVDVCVSYEKEDSWLRESFLFTCFWHVLFLFDPKQTRIYEQYFTVYLSKLKYEQINVMLNRVQFWVVICCTIIRIYFNFIVTVLLSLKLSRFLLQTFSIAVFEFRVWHNCKALQ